MKVQFSLNQKIGVEFDAETQLQMFEQLASLQEVFDQKECGKCKGTDFKFYIRKVQDGKDEYIYPELHCSNLSCRAKLTFGQMKGGSLFPVRYEREGKEYVKDAEGKGVKRGNNGWVKYNRETGKEE